MSLATKQAVACGLLIGAVLLPNLAAGQQPFPRIMVQDSTLNNFVDPPGYETGTLGELGGYKKSGTGPQTMILIPGLGFGAEVFDELVGRWGERFTIHAVTISGFGGTPAPPSPAEQVSFGDQTWTSGALRGIEKLIEKEKIEQPIVVGHWLVGTQLALRLALNHPEKIRAAILLSGATRFVSEDTTWVKMKMALERRVAGIDQFMAPRWYKTVTRETWDDNNFLPDDYAVNPIRGLRLWRMAAQPALHVWTRYLCEFYAQDITLELNKLAVPTLIVKPGLDGIYKDPGGDYLHLYTHLSWEGIPEMNRNLHITTIPESRVCLWFDQPEKLDVVVGEFLNAVEP